MTTSFLHRTLCERIRVLNEPPTDPDDYAKWITGEEHLRFLSEDAEGDELIVYASSQHVFQYAVIVPEQELRQQIDTGDLGTLLDFEGGIEFTRADYTWAGSGQRTFVDSHPKLWRDALPGARPLIYLRNQIRVQAEAEDQFELLQEYAHLVGLPCASPNGRFVLLDENGDDADVVSISKDQDPPVWSVVSFMRYPLAQFLAASESVLIRMFDFSLYDPRTFSMWPQDQEPVTVEESGTVFWKLDAGYAGYLRGVQFLDEQGSRDDILASIKRGPLPRRTGRPVTFLIHDWRNKRLVEVSPDPAATTDYVEKRAGVPFEVSPAFFRPEVLRKYETNPQKYSMEGRDISCSDSWRLRAIGRNAAGQVHAYVRYLRDLPYSEQLHWQSFNEAPKAPISSDIIRVDFEGSWDNLPSLSTVVSPILRRLRRWETERRPWWKCPDDELFFRIRPLLTDNRQEWEDKGRFLARLVIEGLNRKWLRRVADARGHQQEATDGSLRTLERILGGALRDEGRGRLPILRTLQDLRNLASHAMGTKGRELLKRAQEWEGGYRSHFDDLCQGVDQELALIEETLGGDDSAPPDGRPAGAVSGGRHR
jgi:hypothetical protein